MLFLLLVLVFVSFFDTWLLQALEEFFWNAISGNTDRSFAYSEVFPWDMGYVTDMWVPLR